MVLKKLITVKPPKNVYFITNWTIWAHNILLFAQIGGFRLKIWYFFFCNKVESLGLTVQDRNQIQFFGLHLDNKV